MQQVTSHSAEVCPGPDQLMQQSRDQTGDVTTSVQMHLAVTATLDAPVSVTSCQNVGHDIAKGHMIKLVTSQPTP